MSKKELPEAITAERTSGNILIRECRLRKKGDTIPAHTHRYDHTMFFMRGKAKVTTTFSNGNVVQQEIEAPADMLVPKHALHGVEALTNDVYFCCVFPHRDIKGNITDEPNAREAYV